MICAKVSNDSKVIRYLLQKKLKSLLYFMRDNKLDFHLIIIYRIFNLVSLLVLLYIFFVFSFTVLFQVFFFFFIIYFLTMHISNNLFKCVIICFSLVFVLIIVAVFELYHTRAFLNAQKDVGGIHQLCCMVAR